jgi:hypothetical protein
LGLHPTRGLEINVAYDSACSYSIKVKQRFKEHLPNHYEQIEDARFIIDSLHIHNHLDKCMYFFSAAYHDAIGRFAGVGVEQYWAENNQMGPQTRQMNKGHRQDKITLHHSQWNWKKTRKHSKFYQKPIIYPS